MKHIYKHATLNKQAKHESLQYWILTGVLLFVYMCAAVAFFENLREICNILGAIVEKSPWQAKTHFVRDLPNLFFNFGVMYLLSFVFRLFRSPDVETQHFLVKKGSITLICFGGAAFLSLLIQLLTGNFSLIEGHPTPLYPLDLLLATLFMIGLGVTLLVLYPKYHFLDALVGKAPKYSVKRQVGRAILGTIYMMVAVFAFVGIISPLFMLNYDRSAALFTIALIMTFLSILSGLAVYQFIYPRLKDEDKDNCQFFANINLLFLDIIATMFYLLAIYQNPNVSYEVANSILVIDFTASKNAYPYIFGLALYVPLIVSAVKLALRKKKRGQ